MEKNKLIAIVANLAVMVMVLWVIHQSTLNLIIALKQLSKLAMLIFFGKIMLYASTIYVIDTIRSNLTGVVRTKPDQKLTLTIKETLNQAWVELIVETPRSFWQTLKRPWVGLMTISILLMPSGFVASPFAGCLALSYGLLGMAMTFMSVPIPKEQKVSVLTFSFWILNIGLGLLLAITVTAFVTRIPERGLRWFFLGY